MMGIYKIENTINGKVYIGQTVNISKRFYKHRKDQQSNPHLQNAVRKYGIENFNFVVLEQIYDRDRLIETEQFWMDFHDATNNQHGYNIRKISTSNFGTKQSAETVAKRRKAMENYRISAETKEKIRATLLGHEVSDETRARISQSQKGKPKSAEVLAKRKGQTNRAVTYTVSLISPIGEHFTSIYNITKFAKEHAIPLTALYELIRKQRITYKGWVSQ